jgi:outer membrane protein assembly factor BamE
MEEPVAVADKPAVASAVNVEQKPVATAANSDVKGASSTVTQRVLGIFSPYRVSVQQGNFVSREIVSQLKDAMNRKDGVTREQARFILGTPLLMDVFHADRWDYVFRLQKGNGELVSSRVTLFFKGNRLERIDGSELPTERDYLSLLVGGPAPAKDAAATQDGTPPPALTPQNK